MNAKDVIKAFIEGKPRLAGNVSTDGTHFFSFFTCIAQRKIVEDNKKMFIINGTKYSPTSSKHLGMLKKELEGKDYRILHIKDVPRDRRDLEGYLNYGQYFY